MKPGLHEKKPLVIRSHKRDHELEIQEKMSELIEHIEVRIKGKKMAPLKTPSKKDMIQKNS